MTITPAVQTIIVAIILTAAAVYAAWRIRRALSARSSPCYNCEGCPLKDQKTLKCSYSDKKRSKKFGRLTKKQ